MDVWVVGGCWGGGGESTFRFPVNVVDAFSRHFFNCCDRACSVAEWAGGCTRMTRGIGMLCSFVKK